MERKEAANQGDKNIVQRAKVKNGIIQLLLNYPNKAMRTAPILRHMNVVITIMEERRNEKNKTKQRAKNGKIVWKTKEKE